MAEKMDIVVSLKDRMSKGMKGLNKSVLVAKGGVEKLKNAIFGLKAAIVGVAAVFAGKQLIDIANEQAKAVKGMETALRSMGRYTPEFSKQMQDIASNLQSFTNFGDEAVLMGQKFLATYVNITDDLLPRVSLAMVDLSALMGGDMTRAANMMGKASMGMVGQLSLAGISIEKGVYQAEGFVGVLKRIENQSRGQAKAQREATGSIIAMGNSFDDVKEKVGDFLKIVMEPSFKVLLNRFDALNEKIIKLKEEGKLVEWANEVSTKVMDSLKFMVFGTLTVYETFAPIMENFKRLFSGIWDWFKGLPTWVQTSGIILSIMGGKKIKYTLAVLALATESIKSIHKEFSLLRFEADSSATELENNVTLLRALEIRKEQLEKGKGWRLFGDPKDQTEALKLVQEEIEATQILLEKLEAEDAIKLIDADDTEKEVSAIRKSVTKLFDDIEKERLAMLSRLKTVPAEPLGKKKEEEEAKRPEGLMSQAQKDLLSLEVLYQKGEEELIGYLERRKVLVLQTLNEELLKLQELASAETDSGKKLKIEDQLFVKKQEYLLKEIELTKNIEQAHVDSLSRRAEAESMFADLKLRASEELDAVHAAELGEMDERHRLELESFKTLLDDKLAAELGYNDEAAAIKEISRQQELEKDKLLAEQAQQTWDKRLALAGTAATGLKGIFEDLYELGGKKSKSMFKLMKKAAIAEAIINTAKAVSGALGTPPYGLGAIATATLIALKGGLEIAKIKAQEMAGGGRIGGSSPHSRADNIDVKATAGEFMQPISAVKHLGLDVMEGIRTNLFPRSLFENFALPEGARVPSGSSLADGGVAQPGSSNSNFSISVPVNINDERTGSIAGMLREEVEATVLSVMERELR